MVQKTHPKAATVLQSAHRFQAATLGIPAAFFAEIDSLCLKLMWKYNEPWKAKTVLNKNRNGWLILPDRKTYHKATAIKTVQKWLKDRQIH